MNAVEVFSGCDANDIHVLHDGAYLFVHDALRTSGSVHLKLDTGSDFIWIEVPADHEFIVR